MTLLYIFVCFFSLFVYRKGFGYALYSFHTHTHYVHNMSGALYPGLSNFRNRGDCVAV